MEQIFYDLVTADAVRGDDIPVDHFHSGNSIDEDNTPPIPFAVIRWGLRTPGMGAVDRVQVQVWIHDEPGNYDRINRILSRVRGTLDPAGPTTDGAGNWINTSSWQNTSGELFDPGFRTITKNSTFEIIGTGA